MQISMKLEEEINQTRSFKSPYERSLVNIIYTSKWLEEIQTGVFRKFDLTGQQYNILRILRGVHPTAICVKVLRERMLDKMSDASRLVEKLRKKGFVNRKDCKSDRRNVDVTITDKGLMTLNELDGLLAEAEKKFHTLSAEEVKLLGELLDKLRG